MSESMTPSIAPAPFSVTVHAARVSYGNEVLFDGLDVTLAAGRWTCLLGASGVGKSTLLRLILGLEAPQRRAGAGHDEGNTVTCSDGSPLSGRAAYMAQTDLLLPWLTALNNVALGRRLRGASDTSGNGDNGEDEARALLDRVGLAANAGDRPATLSGGMRQRVALARTLMENRPVVLMDEPFSALDAITRIKLQNLAAELLRGRTVLLVTHDPLEALRLGHRIHVMAGHPAHLVDDGEILKMQGDLLRRLADAAP
jgi:putative hydroxymethylpyrimidine transport system ATP-binding protein